MTFGRFAALTYDSFTTLSQLLAWNALFELELKFILISVSIQMCFYPEFGVSIGPAVKIQDQYTLNLETGMVEFKPNMKKPVT